MAESIKEDLKDGRVPSCIFWTCEEVANWIEELGFPDYRASTGSRSQRVAHKIKIIL